MKTQRLLVACEESQRVCTAFRAKGWEAYSCDIIDCSGGHPEWHIKQDVLPLLDGNCTFETCDGTRHEIVGQWDMIIAHPPCTYLSNAGAVRLFKKIEGNTYIKLERYTKGLYAVDFFMKIYNAKCKCIAVENPVPSKIYRLPKYSQIIQPFEHGHPFSKKTCLWLKGLPILKPSEIVKPTMLWISGGSKNAQKQPRKNVGIIRNAKLRSKTFPGIAAAMAEQWENVT